MSDRSEYQFSAAEIDALAGLKTQLKTVAEWPPESPLGFVMDLAPRTRGKLGEMLLQSIAELAGLHTGHADSVAFDVRVGKIRCEVKFSTEDPPRFQQVRDPRLTTGATKYDALVCISGRPERLTYWLIPSSDVSRLMDAGEITVQHAMSDTKWFLPSRTSSDAFSEYRLGYVDFVNALVRRAGYNKSR